MTRKWYRISADGGYSWTNQYLSVEEAAENRQFGYIVQDDKTGETVNFLVIRDEEGNVVEISETGPMRPIDAYQKFTAETGLNGICFGCAKLNKDCEGTKNPVWTGCVGRQIIR